MFIGRSKEVLAVAFGPAGGGLTGCLKLQRWVFPGGRVVKTLPSNAGGVSLTPGLDPCASREKKTKQRTETNCNKFNKDFKNGPHQKTL